MSSCGLVRSMWLPLWLLAAAAVGCGGESGPNDTGQVLIPGPALPGATAVPPPAGTPTPADGSAGAPAGTPTPPATPAATPVPGLAGTPPGTDGGAGTGGDGTTDPEAPPAVPTYVVAPDPTREALTLALTRSTANGPFGIGNYTEGFEDSPGYADATIWYPKNKEPPHAGVAIVPGYLSPQNAISDWGPFLASHGIVVITIGTNDNGENPAMRATALMAALGTLESEHARSGGPLEGKIDTERFGLMGWSMGGGGTLIAAQDNPKLRAAIGLAAYSPGVGFPGISVPTLLFAGTADVLAGGQSQGFYTSIPESTSKMLYEVQGAPHEVANTPTGNAGEVGRFGLSWLKVFLEEDERYRPFLLETPTGTADFRSNL